MKVKAVWRLNGSWDDSWAVERIGVYPHPYQYRSADVKDALAYLRLWLKRRRK